MNRNLFERIISVSGLLAAIAGILGSAGQLAIFMKIPELIWGGLSISSALFAGAASMYIARATKSLTRKARIFISYSFDEKDRARALRDEFAAQGAKVWFDENSLQPGDDIRSAIGAAIESSNTVVALLSDKVGPHLNAELRAAIERNVPIFAVGSSSKLPADLRGSNSGIIIIDADTDPKRVAETVLQANSS